MKHDSKIEKLELTGKQTEGGYLVSGILTWVSNLGSDHLFGVVFKTDDSENTQRVMAEADIKPEDDVIIYCFKGSRASNTFAALRSAGFTKLRNYLGSWYEWTADPSLPIEQGTRE